MSATIGKVNFGLLMFTVVSSILLIGAVITLFFIKQSSNEVKGPQGPPGKEGPAGNPGPPGKDGTNGNTTVFAYQRTPTGLENDVLGPNQSFYTLKGAVVGTNSLTPKVGQMYVLTFEGTMVNRDTATTTFITALKDPKNVKNFTLGTWSVPPNGRGNIQGTVYIHITSVENNLVTFSATTRNPSPGPIEISQSFPGCSLPLSLDVLCIGTNSLVTLERGFYNISLLTN